MIQFFNTRFNALVFLASLGFLLLSTIGENPVYGSFDENNQELPIQTRLYFPLLMHPAVQVDKVWHSDDTMTEQLAFQSGDFIHFEIEATTLMTAPITATLEIVESGPCGRGTVYEDEVFVPSGPWSQTIPALAPGCAGIYTTRAYVHYNNLTASQRGTFIVNEPFSSIYSDGHGFDRCAPADPDDMETWWTQSPYEIVNIYLGGIHYACDNDTLDAFWVREVAEQGWDFTAIWVGPQAPCTNFTYRISSNPSTAYNEGKAEAVMAADRARELGLFGDLTLHYDLEGYSGASSSCRAAVQSFMQGWTDQLHLLGFKAGGYGSPCASYIGDWWSNSPTLDQIWIAHWISPAYDPTVSVWNTACISNNLWPDSQRLRQYAGGHNETWGGVTMPIDSNVFETTAIGWGNLPSGPAGFSGIGVIEQESGWVQAGTEILLTRNGGTAWENITPEGFVALGAGFADLDTGWLVGWANGQPGLQVAGTQDGGVSWTFTSLNPDLRMDESRAARVFVEALDSDQLWVVVKFQTGSSFSSGELLASTDGGRTWNRRTIPLGEPVHFTDSQEGWTAGGPDGKAFFQTYDGGQTWQAGDLDAHQAAFSNSKPTGTVEMVTHDERTAWALVQEGTCTGEKGAQTCTQNWSILATHDGGITWVSVPSPE